MERKTFIGRKKDIKLEALQSRKIQKMSTMLQGKTLILLRLPMIISEIKNGS